MEEEEKVEGGRGVEGGKGEALPVYCHLPLETQRCFVLAAAAWLFLPFNYNF